MKERERGNEKGRMREREREKEKTYLKWLERGEREARTEYLRNWGRGNIFK